jgi:hypothetical protein
MLHPSKPAMPVMRHMILVTSADCGRMNKYTSLTICLHKDCKIVAPQQVMHQKVKTTALIQQPEEIDERGKKGRITNAHFRCRTLLIGCSASPWSRTRTTLQLF